MHKTIVIGNVGKDPEIKTFDNGGKVANFSVGATERGYKTQSGIEVPDHTEWYNCVVKQSGLVKVVEQYLKKGNKIFVSGRMHTRTYDKQDGTKGEAKELIVDEIELLSPKPQSDTQPATVPAPINTAAQQQKDDLPF